MKTKFDRHYTLKAETLTRQPGESFDDTKSMIMGLPYTCEFSINRSLLSSANTAHFKIYNLARDTRNRVYKDSYTFYDFRAIQFSAGYGENPPMVFNGNIQRAWSYRDGGSTEYTTEIEAHEGYAIREAFSSHSYSAGSSYKEVLEGLSGDLPFLDHAVIIGADEAPYSARRGIVLSGKTWPLLQKYTTGAHSFIDNNTFVHLPYGKFLGEEILVINADTGLISSPIRANSVIELTMLFTPGVKIGQRVRVESQTEDLFNGFYKVVGFSHDGVISPVECGVARTKVQLWLGETAVTFR